MLNGNGMVNKVNGSVTILQKTVWASRVSNVYIFIINSYFLNCESEFINYYNETLSEKDVISVKKKRIQSLGLDYTVICENCIEETCTNQLKLIVNDK